MIMLHACPRFSTLFFVALALAMPIQLVHGAEIKLAGASDPGCDKIRGEKLCAPISLTGQIEPGDAVKLQQEIEKVERALTRTIGSARVTRIFLDSLGGNVAEALAIGRFIRSRQIATQVAVGDVCASSCVLVLAGGVMRVPAGSIQIHSFYSPELLGTNDFAKADQTYMRVADSISSYLKEMRVSTSLLDKMMRVPHSSSRALDLQELEETGLLGLDPVYAQSRNARSKE